MSSFNRQINQQNQFIIDVRVLLPTQNEAELRHAIENAKIYRALIDTGAGGCCISKKVVEDLTLKPYTQATIGTAGEPCTSSVYVVDLAIAVTQPALREETQKDGKVVLKPHSVAEGMTFHQVKVFEVPDVGNQRGFDAILGMDILLQLHITLYRGQIVISI